MMNVKIHRVIYILAIFALFGCIKARDIGLPGSAEVPLRQAITYDISSASYQINETIPDNVPTVTLIASGVEDSELTFSISPNLPTGLSFDGTTGILSGTPVGFFALTTFTITVSSATETLLTTTISIEVTGSFTYTKNPATYRRNAPIQAITPVFPNVLTPQFFSLDTPLPAGLVLNTSNGAITGTPTTLVPPTNFIVRMISTNNEPYLANLNLSIVDPLWSTDGIVETVVRGGNTLFIGGLFRSVGAVTGSGSAVDPVTGRRPSGMSWPLINGSVESVIPAPGGGYYIGGSFTRIDGVPTQRVARIRADGTLDTSFATDVQAFDTLNRLATVRTLALSEDGSRLYMGGYFALGPTASLGRDLVAVDANTGAPVGWTPASIGRTFIEAIVVRGSRVYVGGNFAQIGGQLRNGLAALDSSTAAVLPWNPNVTYLPGSPYILTIALNDSGNTLYIGGQFTRVGGTPRLSAAAVDTTTALPTAFHPNVNGQIHAYALVGNTVYAGGAFNRIGGEGPLSPDGTPRMGVVALDSTTGSLTSWDPDLSSPPLGGATVKDIVVVGNVVYVGGIFNTIGDEERLQVAAIDRTTGLATDWNPSAGGEVFALATDGNSIFIGGLFSFINGTRRKYLAALNATTGQATDWDPNPDRQVRTLVINNNLLYVGGDFEQMAGQNRNSFAAFNSDGSLNSWAPSADLFVFDMVIDANNVYAVGNFSTINGTPISRIAAINKLTGSLVTPWNATITAGSAQGIVQNATSIYVGGFFGGASGQPRTNLAAFDKATGNLLGWSPTTNNLVRAITLLDGVVYIGGDFLNVSGVPRNRLAAVNATAGNVTPWNPSPDSFVWGLSSAPGAIYVGGSFVNISGARRESFAILSPDNSATPLGSDHFIPARVYDFHIQSDVLYIGGIIIYIGTNSERKNGIAGFDSDGKLF